MTTLFDSHPHGDASRIGHLDRVRFPSGRVGEAGSRLTAFSRQPEFIGPDRGRRSHEPYDLLTIDA